jgi:PPOX class probable F420-dependent enzyme
MADIVTPADRREFVRSHRTAIFGYRRKNDGPAMTALYYVMDGDDILISTMQDRAKAKAIARDPKVSLCVLDEQWPPTYITVFCDATIDATADTDLDAVVDLNARILEVMAGRPLEQNRAEAEELAKREGRVRLRLRPYETFMTPPRHVYSEDDLANLTHWTSASVPWDAE